MGDARALCLLAAVLLAGWISSADAGGESTTYSIYLVRHAEKTSEAADPGLTPDGIERAQRLARWLAGHQIATIWSSDYRRTRETAAPSAATLELSTKIYNPRELEKLASMLSSNAENALVVGHSNTTPQLAAILCRCEVTPMPESEYDRMIKVTVEGDHRSVKELDQASLRQAPGDH